LLASIHVANLNDFCGACVLLVIIKGITIFNNLTLVFLIMKLELYQIDAFTNEVFGGNPACVVPLNEWLPDQLLFQITRENAVAETAFFIIHEDHIHLRWFTPEVEMDLCGHATLATAHVLTTILNYGKQTIVFRTLSGELRVRVDKDRYTLDFPSRKPVRATLPGSIKDALNLLPIEVLKARDYVLVYENEQHIKDIKINRQVFDEINLDTGGVIVTARGDDCDFVSRFFTPQAAIMEDPVTGSAHCSLIPFWSERLQLTEMHAKQISERVGNLYCVDQGKRVLITGQAKTYSSGTIWLDMKLAILLVVFAVLSSSCQQAGVAKEKVPTNQIIGTWRLVSDLIITKGDTAVSYPVKGQDDVMIKIYNASHFSFFKHDTKQGKSKNAVFDSGAGTYKLSGTDYSEHLEYCNYRKWENHDFKFQLRIQRDTLVQRGIERIDSLNVNREVIETYVRLNASK
jgi:PhzF family phenazine biosynthesis protein